MPLRPPSPALLALLCCSLAPSAAAQEAYTFTPRLGPAIDAEERAYFGLFPEVDGFAEAHAMAQGDSIGVTIETSAADSVLTMSRVAAEALGRFVETFEHSTTAFYNPNWQFVKDYVRADIPVPYIERRGSVTAFVNDGYYEGHPVYASDDLLVLDSSPSFDWRAYTPDGTPLQVSDIDAVRISEGLISSPYAPLLGMVLGFTASELLLHDPEGKTERRLISPSFGAVTISLVRLWANRSRSLPEALPRLKSEAWFTSEVHPPELPEERDLQGNAEAPRTPRPRWRSRFGWIDSGVGTVLAPPTSTYTFFSNFEGLPAEQEVDYATGGALETAFALRPLAWLSVGVGVFSAPTPSPGDDALQEVAFSKPSFRTFAEIDAVRLIASRSPVGVAFGGGFLRAESVVAQSFPENFATTYAPDSYEIREQGFEPFYTATLEAYLLPETAAFVRVLRWTAPSVVVPRVEVQSVAFPGTVVFRVEPHTVTFGQTAISVGVRVGL